MVRHPRPGRHRRANRRSEWAKRVSIVVGIQEDFTRDKATEGEKPEDKVGDKVVDKVNELKS
jgi:hypothetical protein